MMGPEKDLTQTPGLREQYAAGLSWLAFICQVLETSAVVFLRREFGARYFGGQAAAVIPVALLYCLAWQGHDIRPMFIFLGLYLLLCLKGRISGWRARRKGVLMHSRYSGYPSVMRMRPFRGWLSEKAAKGVIEPVCVAGIGIALMEASEPLGTYLLIAAVGLMLSMGFSVAWQQQRVMDAQDAYLTQREDAKLFRDQRWE